MRLLQNTKKRLGLWLWRRTVRVLGDVVFAADSWIHEQERRLQESVAAPAPDLTVDRAESAIREKAIVRSRRKQRLPRLRYEGGAFVRQEA
jgi:hypothetical protein